MLLAFNYLWTK